MQLFAQCLHLSIFHPKKMPFIAQRRHKYVQLNNHFMRFILFIAFFFLTSVNVISQITKYPLLEYSSADHLVITAIEILDKKETRVTKISFEFSPQEDQFLLIPTGMYINDVADARLRYELLEVENKEFALDQWYPVQGGKLYQYELIFEGLKDCTEQINIYEPKLQGYSPWVWQKIRLNNTCQEKERKLASNSNATKKIIGY